MKLLWLDLETTGLDPRACSILEIVVMQADFATPFEAEPRYHAIFRHDGTGLSTFIRDMHTKNGLLAECEASWLCVEEADEALSVLLLQPESSVLAGSSIHFDLGFLREHMPKFAKLLSHRLYDVSAIKLFCESLGMPKLPKAEAHRAQADVLESIDHAQRCAAWVVALPAYTYANGS